MIDVHDRSDLQQLRSRLRLDPHRLKRARVQFYKNQGSAEQALEEIPAPIRGAFAEAVRFHRLQLVDAIDSQQDGATKLLFATDDDLQIETVILRVKSGRTALCVSSQIGCAAACEFCATGQLGLRRNLTASEILDQVVQANQRLLEEGQRVRNIVEDPEKWQRYHENCKLAAPILCWEQEKEKLE